MCMPLTVLMRERLVRRDELDAATKKANEYNVRKYITNYFKDLEEILWVLDQLPERQIARLFKDEDVYRLQALEEKALTYLDFMSPRLTTEGADEQCPKLSGYVSKSLLTLNRLPDGTLGDKILSEGRKMTNQDINRWLQMMHHKGIVDAFVSERAGVVTNKDFEYYYRDLIKTARRQKLSVVRPSDAALLSSK
jgi:hypothetical protein